MYHSSHHRSRLRSIEEIESQKLRKQLHRREGRTDLQVDKDVELKRLDTDNAGAAHSFCFGSSIGFQHTCINSHGYQINCLHEHVDFGSKVSSRFSFFHLLLPFACIADPHSLACSPL